ncbi:MAG: 3'-5' exonuclease [Oscillibacter sp.]|nr:3'-5' exonuclease [Oscillibacter sp.]
MAIPLENTKNREFYAIPNFVVQDTETTGLKCSSDEIIDIAAIRFRNFQPVDKFSMLLAPKKSIPERITAINHITDEMVAGCPCFQQVALSLVEFIGDDNIVGHNLPFDLKFIVHYGADVTTKKRKYYDTLALAQKTVKKVKMKWDKELEVYMEDDESEGISNYKLETLCSYFDIINRNAHRAEGDALATGMLFHKLAEIRKG